MMSGLFRVAASLALSATVLLAGCSGGGSAPAAPAAAKVTGPLSSGSVSFVIAAPATGTSKTVRKPAFISASASSVGISVNGGTATFTNVGATSPNCTGLPGSTRTCTVDVTAPAGTPTILIALYDGPNGTGHMIAEGSAEPSVVIGQTFTATATMAPIVAALTGGSVTYVSGTQFIPGSPETATVSVGAADADGTAIPSTSSFAAGVALSSSDSHITITPALWTSPAQPVTLSYDGSPAVASTVTITFANSLTPTLPLVQIPLSVGVSFTFTEFPVLTAASEPVGITSGPDGALWFVEQTGNNVGRITTAGAVTEFAIPTVNSAPTSVAAGSDGNLWFTEESGNKIGRINPATHIITEFSAGIGAFSLPFAITSNPDGNLYFTEFDGNKIAQITPAGVVTEFTIPTPGTNPQYIVSGPDNALWFTQTGTNQIGRMTTAGVFTETTIPTATSLPSGIAKGPDGALWFLEESGAANKVGRITTAGVITNEFTIPTATSHPMTIVTGADGNLWFTENNNTANKVARMTPAGAFLAEFPVPTVNSGPCSIALGPDNGIWFAENNAAGNKIGRI
jgi:streptogramin lyase